MAACSQSPQSAVPPDTTIGDGSVPSSDEDSSASAGTDDPAEVGDRAGVGDEASVGDATAAPVTTETSPSTAADGSVGEVASPGSSGEGDAADGDAAAVAPGEGSAPDATSGEGATLEAGSDEDGNGEAATPEYVTPESEFGEEVAPAPYLEFDPFVTGPFAPLTGSITTDLSLATRRPLAVKIGNGDPVDQPQAGLAAADIVYEVLVEAAKTRFVAVFHSQIPTRIGPVRSARSSDFDILRDLATPYFASSGANNTVLREMRQAAREEALIDVGAMRMAAPYSRDPSRRSPHNLYFSYEQFAGDGESLPGGLLDSPPRALFGYASPDSPSPRDAVGVTVAYRSLHGTEVSHVWDNIGGGWVRIQRGALHTTETEFGVAEIAPANVVVVQMPYGRSAADRRSPQALSYGSGDALVLTAGAVHEARWERTQDRIGFRFTDKEGNPISLSAGATWLLLANSDGRWPIAEVTVLTAAEGARLLADARAAAP